MTPKDIKHSCEKLSHLLANTYLLYLKTQNYHWHVEGSNFYMLHEFFGKQYAELAEAVDEIAERIRMLGEHAPASFHEFLKLTSLTEKPKPTTSSEMIKALLSDHNLIVKELRNMLKDLEDSRDEATIDFLIGRLHEHEKMAWMLNAHLS